MVNRGKANGGWTVIASLKGYELRMVDAQDSPLRQFFLDEYVRHMRFKYINRLKKLHLLTSSCCSSGCSWW